MTDPRMTLPPEQSEALLELAARVANSTSTDNALDVLVEIALFEPDELVLGIRPNNAGTKVILTIKGGKERTVWSNDWTLNADRRRETAAALRARSLALQPGGE